MDFYRGTYTFLKELTDGMNNFDEKGQNARSN